MIELVNISKQFADKVLFDKINLTIYDGERVGIVGENGSGKSTLMNIIAGEVLPDSGIVNLYGDKIGYLKQITEYSKNDFLNIITDENYASEFLKIISKLKLDKSIDFSDARLEKLSGGEKTKIMLAHVLSKEPHVLLLDEPTNHLDLDGVDWLIKTLDSYNGTIVVVSHDRYFLNAIANKIIEVENGQIKEFYGNYDQYKSQKDSQLIELKNKYEEQKHLERKINAQIRQLNEWSNKAERESRRQGGMMSDSKIKGAQTKAQVSAGKLANSAKAKASRLEQAKSEFIERPYEEGKVHYRLTAKDIGSKVLIRVEDLNKAFGDNQIIKNTSFIIGAGEKVALKGRNGCGKTTLIRILMGKDKDFQGSVWVAPSVKMAYLSQDVFDLNEELTVMDIAKQGGNSQYTTLFLTNLVNMNMKRQVFDRKIKTLSLGERMRVKMSEIVLSDYNLLVLDEPTNHLDLANKIYLEKILKDYEGTLILVSHDRTLTNNVCDYELTFEDKEIKKNRLEAHENEKNF